MANAGIYLHAVGRHGQPGDEAGAVGLHIEDLCVRRLQLLLHPSRHRRKQVVAGKSADHDQVDFVGRDAAHLQRTLAGFDGEIGCAVVSSGDIALLNACLFKDPFGRNVQTSAQRFIVFGELRQMVPDASDGDT